MSVIASDTKMKIVRWGDKETTVDLVLKAAGGLGMALFFGRGAICKEWDTPNTIFAFMIAAYGGYKFLKKGLAAVNKGVRA